MHVGLALHSMFVLPCCLGWPVSMQTCWFGEMFAPCGWLGDSQLHRGQVSICGMGPGLVAPLLSGKTQHRSLGARERGDLDISQNPSSQDKGLFLTCVEESWGFRSSFCSLGL